MLKKFKLFDLLLLLTGFLYGNLFAISFSNKDWNIFFIFFIVIFLEFSNKTIYFFFGKTKRNSEYSQQYPTQERSQYQMRSFGLKFISGKSNLTKNNLKNIWFILINTLKRGFILGLFVEAFKVGS